METDLLALLAQNKIALACALFAFLTIRALRDDVKWFFTLPATLPIPFGGGARFDSKRLKPWLAVLAAFLEGAYEMASRGKTWPEALKSAFIVAALPVLFRELGLKIENPKVAAGGAALALIGMIGLTQTGCAGSFEEARLVGLKTASPLAKASAASSPADIEAYCRDLDKSRATYGAIAKTTGLLAGASGLTSIPFDDKAARTALVAGSVVAGAVAVGSLLLEESKASTWARDCSAR